MQQEKDEPLLRQEASSYIKNLRYRPSQKKMKNGRALMLFRLGGAAAAGAALMALLHP
jgi:hypothetical protein